MADGIWRAWRARPIFVTSTSRDMHAERDYQRNFVFPVLRVQPDSTDSAADIRPPTRTSSVHEPGGLHRLRKSMC